MSINVARLRKQALVTTWSCTGLIAFGIAWALGLQTSWWQRALIALPLAVLAVLDARGAGPVMDARIALTRLIADFGWLQIPLAVAGGAWLTGLTPDAGTRIALAAVLATVAGLFHLAPSAPAPAGGNR
jgi:hypothetical protein